MGLAALDVVTPSDAHLREILQSAGAVGAGDANITSSTPSAFQLQDVAVNVANIQEPPLTEAEKKDWIKYVRFQQDRDSPNDTRNVLLAVAALIATVTFQAGVDPPEGFTRGKTRSDSAVPPHVAPSPDMRYSHPVSTVGIVVLFTSLGSLAAASRYLFLLGYSLGPATSICVIIYHTAGFPFQRELHLSLYSMSFAYGWAVQDIDSGDRTKVDITVALAFLLPFSLRWLPRWTKNDLEVVQAEGNRRSASVKDSVLLIKIG